NWSALRDGSRAADAMFGVGSVSLLLLFTQDEKADALGNTGEYSDQLLNVGKVQVPSRRAWEGPQGPTTPLRASIDQNVRRACAANSQLHRCLTQTRSGGYLQVREFIADPGKA